MTTQSNLKLNLLCKTCRECIVKNVVMLIAKRFWCDQQKEMGGRGVIGDKWSMKILWMCAIGSAIGMHS